jgi:hypothetical protein
MLGCSVKSVLERTRKEMAIASSEVPPWHPAEENEENNENRLSSSYEIGLIW